MKDIFRYFIKVNFLKASSQMTIQDIDNLGEQFHKYLDGKLKDETKEKIMPKSAMYLIMNSNHPLRQNGFHPAYVMHFHEWIKLMQETHE